MRKALQVVALAGGLTLCVGCGADPVRAELEAYQRAALDVVIREERAGAEQLTSALTGVLAGTLEVRAAQALYRDSLAERFRSLSARLIEYRPTTPALAQINARLAGQYQQCATELERAAVELGRGNWAAFEAVHARLAKLGFDAIRPELVAFAAQHGMDVEPQTK